MSVDYSLVGELLSLPVNDLVRLEKLAELRKRRIYFAKEFHVNTHGERLDFSVPALEKVYNTLAADVAIMGSMQSLKSEWLIVDHLAAASLGMAVFYVLPKYDSRDTFVQNRIDRCISQVPEYKKYIGEGFFDNKVLKNFGKGVVKYVGSNVPADFREFPADFLAVDEVDECDEKQLSEAAKRMGNSKYRFSRWLGNPQFEDESEGIYKRMCESTFEEWHAPCERCGKLTELDWFKVVVKEIKNKRGDVISYQLRDGDWTHRSKRDIWCVCPYCGGPLLRFDPAGQWKARFPNRRMEGYHFSKLVCNKTISVAEMWEEFQKAIGVPDLYQIFMRDDLGLPYRFTTSTLTDEFLKHCALLPDFILGETDGKTRKHVEGPCSMGIDVGSNFFDVRISELSGPKRKATYIGKVQTVRELLDLGHKYNVDLCVIDSEPEVRTARQFQNDAPFTVWRCKYPPGEGKDKNIHKNWEELRLTKDRTTVLDESFSDLKQKRNLLPKNYKNLLGGTWLKEMVGPKRELLVDKAGSKRYVWTKCVDHARHADAYDKIASELSEGAMLTEDNIYIDGR